VPTAIVRPSGLTATDCTASATDRESPISCPGPHVPAADPLRADSDHLLAVRAERLRRCAALVVHTFGGYARRQAPHPDRSVAFSRRHQDPARAVERCRRDRRYVAGERRAEFGAVVGPPQAGGAVLGGGDDELAVREQPAAVA
jgi:hypothetical protein